MKNIATFTSICRIAACCVFLGRAWQFLRWDAPVRTLLWSQDSMEWLISGWFGVSWQTWVSSPAVDQGIQFFVRSMGAVFLICAVLTCLVQQRHRWMGYVISIGSVQLVFLTFLQWKGMAWQIGMLIEHALQVGVPSLLLIAIFAPTRERMLQQFTLIAIALTFIGHGLYAAGIHPTPGHFVTMIMNTLNLTESSARSLLQIAGYLDFVVAAALFIPRLTQPALLYCAIWGGLTASARVVGYMDANQILLWLDAWGYQTLYRLVHGLIPLALYLTLSKRIERQSQPQQWQATAEVV